MPLWALSPSDTKTESPTSTAPWWGAWSAILIVGGFYLTQAVGIFMVYASGGVVTIFSGGLEAGTRFGTIPSSMEYWLLPLSLFMGTLGGLMVSWQVATSRAKPSMEIDWFWQLLGKSYDCLSLWRFLLLGLSLGLGFFALTEYGVLPPDDLPQPIFDAMLAAPLYCKLDGH